jgi:1-acyl-sn-glycerol-3-phosphate acyltransferase
VPPVRITLATSWRACATGFCFVVFGLGQLLLAATLFPLLVLLVRDERQRIRLGRQIVNRAFRAFILLMAVLGVLRYRVRGRERLNQPGTLILANHPSLIDVVFLISFVPEADCVVRASLFRNPFTRYALLAAGYISSHQDPEQVLSACRASLQAGGILIVFPEGTRSEPGEALCFKRGAANLAIRLGCDMVPVVIRVGDHNLGKRSRWWRVPARRMPYDFEVKERLHVAPWRKPGQEPAIAARELTAFLTDYFGREVRTPCPSWLPR